MNWASWALTINAAARHLYKLSRRRVTMLALVAVAACGASDASGPNPVLKEKVGESRAAISAIPTSPVTEDFSSALLGGNWPAQWATAPGSNATSIVTTTPFSAAGQLGRFGGAAGSGSIRYLSGLAPVVDSDQVVNVAIGTGTGVEHAGLVTRLSGLASSPNTPSFANYYGVLVGDLAGSRLRFYKTLNGAYIQVGAVAPATPVAGVSTLVPDGWYRLRFKVTQINAAYTLLQAKLWQGVEPSAWTLEHADNDSTLKGVSGYSGIAASFGSPNNRFLYYDDYRIEGAQPPTTCTLDSDCASGRYCSQGGECRVYGTTCSSSSMCGVGQSCQNSQCVCASPPTGVCAPDAGPAPTLGDLMSGFPNLRYRVVTYARETTDYFVLPTLTSPTTAPVGPELRRQNHFILNVPSSRTVALTFDVGNSAVASNPALDVIVYNAAGLVTWRGSLDSQYPGHRVSVANLFTLAAGNYELDVIPRDPTLTYTVTATDPGVTLAFKGGADLAQAGAVVSFFVPAETETAFLVGAFDAAIPVQFASPDGVLVTPQVITPTIYAIDTKGKPGVWKTSYRTTSSPAHFVNLPDIFSFDKDASLTATSPTGIIASKRIRTEMSSPTGGSPVAVASPPLRYNNRFAFHVATAGSPSFIIGSSTAGTQPHITINLIDAKGVHQTGSPFDITPGVTKTINPALVPGDYELHVLNPTTSNAYTVTVPPNVPFVSVDGYGLGNIYSANNRAYFTVPAGTTSVFFAAKPVTVPIDVYNPAGVKVTAPLARPNNIYEIPNVTPGTWSLNLQGDTWSDIRFLNVPQIVSFNSSLHQTTGPGGITTCTTNADCASPRVCGQDNGAAFGMPTTADVCWLPSCGTAQAPAGSCGSIYAECGTTCSLCSDGVKDAGESDIDCGGPCAPCGAGKQCNDDCAPSLVCGHNNGAYFGLPRTKRVCWPEGPCGDGIDSSECGTPTSLCGPYCGGIPCTPPDGVCPLGEVCKAGLGQLFDVDAPGVCADPSCPSNDPAKCGAADSLCGKQCICTPDCSHATAADPSDGCNGQCPGVCGLGQACCSLDVHCPVGAACIAQASGPGICRDQACAYKHVAPPLCGQAGALCGETCPVCTPACGNRQCGADPECGTSCGSCPAGELCTESGQCATKSSYPPPTVVNSTGETVPVPPVAAGPTVPAGALAGSFSVSEQGTAQYSVPIEVPPGRAGMQPALSLVYAGPRVEGTAGAGWKLEGLSQITRCPRVYALDGYPAPIKNDTTDRFCIDGKRLETIAGSSAYGADGAEYRTLVDTFTKVISHSSTAADANGPEWFQAWTKDGRILTYGKTRDALVLTGTGVRNTWLLQRVEDRSRNNMIVRYRNERLEMPAEVPHLAASVVVPASIFYTGSDSIEGDREVRFDYKSRIDSVTRFVQGGVPMVTQYRLSRITTYAQGAAVKNYQVEYESELRSQIKRVRECAGTSDICKAPTEFGYIQDVGFEVQPSRGHVQSGAQLDINGDGIPDYLNTTALIDGVAANPTAVAAFVTADVAIGVGAMFAAPGVGVGINIAWMLGKMILFDALAHTPTVTYSTNLSIGTKLRSGNFQYVQASGYPCPGSPGFFLDFDRDGKDDVVSACERQQLGFARSAGDGTFTNRTDMALGVNHVPRDSPLPRPTFLDVNGDAREDVLYCSDASTLHVQFVNNTGGFTLPMTFTGRTGDRPNGGRYQERIPYCSDALPIHSVTDVDGDGTPELMALYTPNEEDRGVFNQLSHSGVFRKPGMYALRLSPPTPSGPRELFWAPVDAPNIGTEGWGYGAITGDFNGDGLVDIVKSYALELMVWLNTGSGFQLRRVPYPRPPELTPASVQRRLATLDYDGDGKGDLVQPWDTENGDLFNVLVQPLATPAPKSFLLNQISVDLNHGLRHARIDAIRDVDGDGNVDVSTGIGLFYGRGLRNGLLSSVTDGLGNRVEVDYFDAYKSSCETEPGSQWPEKCLTNIKGLVSGYRAGFVVSADGGGGFAAESSYTYSYENARVSMTGHGWLGFDKVTMKETSGGSSVKTTTTEFMPPTRYHTTPGVPAASVETPYLYPLAGLPRVVTVDETAIGGLPEPSLEDVPHLRRTQRVSGWEVALSADNRPYPRLRLVNTETLSCDLPVIGATSSQVCAARTHCAERNDDFDGYGNVTFNVKSCDVPPPFAGDWEPLETVTTTVDTFTLDRASWLIEHPANVHIEAERLYPGFAVPEKQDYRHQYDSLGRPILTVRDPAGQSEQSTIDYDEFGNVERITRTAPLEIPRTTIVTYAGDHVLPVSIENAEGHVTQVRFSQAFGQLETLVDPNGVTLQHAYDGFGRRTLSVTPTGSTTYDLANSLTTYAQTGAGEIHPRLQLTIEQRGMGSPSSFGGRSEQLIDSHGRVVRNKTIGLQGVEVISNTIFDSRGRVVATTAPRTTSGTPVTTKYEYDFLDRPTRITLPDGSVGEHRYASGVHLGAGQPQWLNQLPCPWGAVQSCGVDIELATEPHLPGEAVRQSVIVRDFNGQVVRTFDGENVTSAAKPNDFEYQPFARVSKLLDNLKTPTVFRHDPYGRLISHRDPDSGERTYTYNAFGELLTSLDAKSQLRTFKYDRLGRLVKVVDGPVEDDEHRTTWFYDTEPGGIGQLAATHSPASPESPGGQHVLYQYYTAGQHRGLIESVVHRIDAYDYRVGLHYDDLGRARQVDYPNLDTGAPIKVEYGYDDLSGALTSVSEVGGIATHPIWSLTEAFQGVLPSAVQFGNGASSTLTYDPKRYTLDSIQTRVNGNVIQNLGYHRLANGQIHEHSNTRSGQLRHFAYQYDLLGRLQQTAETFPGQPDTVQDYGYDDRGNLTNLAGKAITFTNPAHPHLPDLVGSTTYGHDDNGNLVNRAGFEIPGWTQLISHTPFDLPAVITTGDSVTTLDYTADQQRVVRRDATEDRHFVGDLYERALTPDGINKSERFRISAGAGVVAEITRTPTEQQTLYFHPDALGTPETITDPQGVAHYQDFAPFGGRRTGDTSLTRLGFTGHQQDDDLGLIDMGGRVYDPIAGRFTTADPIMQAPFSSQGQNRYAYVFNDPINMTDPSGFAWQDTGSTGGNIAWGIGAAAWGGTAIYALGSASGISLSGMFPGGSSSSAGLGAVGLVGNVVQTLLGNPFGGSPEAKFTVAAPSAVSNTSPVKPGAANAVGLGRAPGPAQGTAGNLAAPSGPVPRGPGGNFSLPSAPTGAMRLLYNIKQQTLDVENSAGARYQLRATSGRGICQNNASAECLGKYFNGPIVPGQYYIRTSEIITNPARMWWIRRAWRANPTDWGSFRVELRPYADTARRIQQLNRTGNFYLHGGSLPGSGGCVDCGGGVTGNGDTNRLVDDLKGAHAGNAWLTVVPE